MKSKRCLYTTVYTIIFLIVGGVLRPQPVDPIKKQKAAEDRFWVLKTHCSSKFDMVLMGDSRLYRSVSPSTMESILNDYRILNFGYSSGGLNTDMYKEAEGKLDPESKKKMVVLAVTPYSLTPDAAKNEHFLQEKTRHREDIYQRLYFNSLLKFFEPTTPHDVLDAIKGKKNPPSELYYEEFHDDGWVASWIFPENPEKALKSYRNTFSKTKVSSKLVQELLEKTQHWIQQGIQVVAFRPPTTQKMIQLEQQLSNFNENIFIKQFKSVGGIWFSFNGTIYHSYDGSHLRKDSAIRFSIDLAMKIKNYLLAHHQNT